MDARETRAQFGSDDREHGDARGPRIAEAAKFRRRSRTQRLVAIECCEFSNHGPAAARAATATISLSRICGEVMVDRIFLERPRHGVVASEWHEAATDEYRSAKILDRFVRTNQQLVDVRVRMPAVDEALAVSTGVESSPRVGASVLRD